MIQPDAARITTPVAGRPLGDVYDEMKAREPELPVGSPVAARTRGAMAAKPPVLSDLEMQSQMFAKDKATVRADQFPDWIQMQVTRYRGGAASYYPPDAFVTDVMKQAHEHYGAALAPGDYAQLKRHLNFKLLYHS